MSSPPSRIFTSPEVRGASLARSAQMIRHNLERSDKWLVRGLLAIYARQTADERMAGSTHHDNGRGFTGSDARILASLAKQVEMWQLTPPSGRQYASPLSPKQLAIVRVRMAKYARQLARVVRERRE